MSVFECLRQDRLRHLVDEGVLAVDQSVDRREVGSQPTGQPAHGQRLQSTLVDQRQSFSDHAVHRQVRQRHTIVASRGG
ncbi:hypothetical protein A5637_03020 [Mycolicibacterium fortuitum]|nr:hypothetical protein A5637_03020 [Mycolicibacterium fortuitum]